MTNEKAPEMPPTAWRPLMWDGVFSRLMDALTGGAFLAGLTLLSGASNFVVGLVAALPFLGQVAQLPALALLLRVQDRRKAVLWLAGASRVLLGLIAVVLLWNPSRLTAPVLVLVLSLAAVLTVAATAAWNWWMRDLLPEARLGSFFSRRMTRTTVVAMVALPLAGRGLDFMVQRGWAAQGYGLLFAAGCLCGLVGLAWLSRAPHAPAPPSPKVATSLGLLREAFARRGTRGAIAALGTVSAAASFALPFAAVFLLRDLRMSFLVVMLLAVVSQLGYLASLRGWGHLSDHYGDRGVLTVSMALLAASLAGWALTGWRSGFLLIPWLAALHFIGGFALGGADLGGTNLMLKTAPAHAAQAHMAAVGLSKALLAGLGALTAGFLWDRVGSGTLWTLSIGPAGTWALGGFQLLCAVGAAITLLAGLALVRVREVRHRPVVEVARTMRREVQQMSSVAGIRVFIHAVSYVVELMASPFSARTASIRGSEGQPEPGSSDDPT
jgi:MFS family permease